MRTMIAEGMGGTAVWPVDYDAETSGGPSLQPVSDSVFDSNEACVERNPPSLSLPPSLLLVEIRHQALLAVVLWSDEERQRERERERIGRRRRKVRRRKAWKRRRRG